MIGTDNGSRLPGKAGRSGEQLDRESRISAGTEDLRLRAQQLSLREQMERNHFLLERLNAASARLIQSLETGDVFEAIAEIIANLVGSEEVAIFHYLPSDRVFSLAWSCGVNVETLQKLSTGAGLMERAARDRATQFRERHASTPLLPHEKNLTACVVLKSSNEVVGVIDIFGLLPQKNRLEWADFELLKFLEIYAAVAIQFRRLQSKQVAS